MRYVQSKRAYGDNTVLNLYLSMVQNFLTVLSGAPGVGKTSICGIIADSLGMNTFNDTLPESLQNRMSLIASYVCLWNMVGPQSATLLGIGIR